MTIYESISKQIFSSKQVRQVAKQSFLLKVLVENLDFHYGSVQALSSISMDIFAQQVTASIGPSGCGKPTFLRCLNRMNETIPNTRMEGEVFIDGEDIYLPTFRHYRDASAGWHGVPKV